LYNEFLLIIQYQTMILISYSLKHCFEIISNTFDSITNLQQRDIYLVWRK